MPARVVGRPRPKNPDIGHEIAELTNDSLAVAGYLTTPPTSVSGTGVAPGDIDVNGTTYKTGVIDGSVDVTDTFVTALEQLEDDGNGRMFIGPGIYQVTPGELFLPETVPQGGPIFTIEGSGAALYGGDLFSTSDGALLACRAQSTHDEAIAQLNRMFNIRGLAFVAAGRVDFGLRLEASYLSTVESCKFVQCDNNFGATFCLGLKLQNCLGSLAYEHEVFLRTYEGAASHGCNSTVLDQVRCYAANGSTASLRIADSSNVTLRNCITEGGVPTNSVWWSSALTTNTNKAFLVQQHHCENQPSNSHFKIDAFGNQILQNIWVNAPNSMILDASGAHNTAVFDLRIPFFQYAPAFRHLAGSATKYVFTDCGVNGAANPESNAAYWDLNAPYGMPAPAQIRSTHF